MRKEIGRIFTLVKQVGADNLLLVLIVVSALTVILTRVFLELTGYPQIGDSTFHIAHVLWGGLLLFVAVATVLIYANHWMLWFSAILGGIGAGLFIDEVGKFITQSNDYLYPLAFPIIYAFVVACVWLYFRVRRTSPRDTRTLLYHSLELMQEFLDNDLDPFEHADLVQSLGLVATTAEDPLQRKMATAMLTVVKSRARREYTDLNWFERKIVDVTALASSWPSRTTLRWILIVGFLLLSAGSILELLGLYTLASTDPSDLRAALSQFAVINGQSQYAVSHPNLLLANGAFMLIVGVTALVSALMLWRGIDQQGLRVGVLGLVFSLSIVNLLTFYFNQMFAIVDTLGQLALLGLAQMYRWRFYLHPKQVPLASTSGEVAVPV